MRSYNVDSLLVDREVIKEAIIKVCKSKKKKKRGRNRKYKKAQEILKDLDRYTEIILEMILAFEIVQKTKEVGGAVDIEIYRKAFKTKTYQRFTAIDESNGKERDIISVPLFPDQIIHQLLISTGESVYMKGMYEYTCGSIPKRGIHKGTKYIKKIINHHTKTDKTEIKYCGQLDITKCYQSISHDYLKGLLRKKFRGKLYIWLSYAVIDSYTFYKDETGSYGLPIGFSTSQWWCNFTLTPLDHYIKGELGVKYFIRYVDDIIMFGRNKKKLHQVVRKIMEFLKSIGLRIKDNWQVFRFDYEDPKGRKDKKGRVKRRGRPLDTLGYRFFRNKTILRKRNALKIRRQVKRVSKMKEITAHAAQSLMSRLGWLRHCNSFNFWHKYVKPFINIRKLKEVIRNESRKHNQTCVPV